MCIQKSCSREFEEPMLNRVIELLTKTVVGWILQVYGQLTSVACLCVMH